MKNENYQLKKDEYLFYLQKFLDISENIKDEQLKKEIVSLMLKCNNALIELIIQDIENMNKSIQ